MKWKRQILGLLAVLVIGTLAACGHQAGSKQTSSSQSSAKSVAAKPYISSTTPTFYVHGFQGSARSTNTLIRHAEQQADAQKVIVATVATDGTVSYSGHWRTGQTNPIVQVVFKNNLGQYPQQSSWLTSVISQLAKAHHFTKYNVVAHSAGNVATVNMLMTANLPANFPKISKFASIAGPYDGVITEDDVANQNYFTKSGAPKYQHAAYQLLDAKRANFPNGISVLNIVGNLNDGSNSDSLVSNVSARSLKYLIRGHQTNYREQDFYGKQAQHSRLHENPKVAKAVDQFIWGNPNYHQK